MYCGITCFDKVWRGLWAIRSSGIDQKSLSGRILTHRLLSSSSFLPLLPSPSLSPSQVSSAVREKRRHLMTFFLPPYPPSVLPHSRPPLLSPKPTSSLSATTALQWQIHFRFRCPEAVPGVSGNISDRVTWEDRGSQKSLSRKPSAKTEDYSIERDCGCDARRVHQQDKEQSVQSSVKMFAFAFVDFVDVLGPGRTSPEKTLDVQLGWVVMQARNDDGLLKSNNYAEDLFKLNKTRSGFSSACQTVLFVYIVILFLDWDLLPWNEETIDLFVNGST